MGWGGEDNSKAMNPSALCAWVDTWCQFNLAWLGNTQTHGCQDTYIQGLQV